MFEDFNTDLDNLIASKTKKNGKETKISVDDFCEYFMKIHPWNDPNNMDGAFLNIRKLLVADRDWDSEKDHDHPACEHSLVRHGHIDFFNLRVLGLLICKGDYHYKAKALYKLLWDKKDALEKHLVIGWSQIRL